MQRVAGKTNFLNGVGDWFVHKYIINEDVISPPGIKVDVTKKINL